MKAQASNLLIGSLTLALIAGSLGAVLGYQKFAGTRQRVPLRVVFEGSASGLHKGGSVNFGGVRVGEVVALKLDNPRRVVALAMIDNRAPIRKDTLAGLEFQGLTGVAALSPAFPRFAKAADKAGVYDFERFGNARELDRKSVV